MMTPDQAIKLRELEKQNGLPSGLLSTVMQAESGGNPMAVSSAGAVGPFQFMPKTAQQYGVQDPTNFDQAAQGAARMYGDLSAKYQGDVPSMLAAYNWGQGNVDRQGLDNAPAETRNYIAKITAALAGQQPQDQQVADAQPKQPFNAMDTAWKAVQQLGITPANAEEMPQSAIPSSADLVRKVPGAENIQNNAAQPQGRDLSNELFGDSGKSDNAPEGRDLSAELFGGERRKLTAPEYKGVPQGQLDPEALADQTLGTATFGLSNKVVPAIAGGINSLRNGHSFKENYTNAKEYYDDRLKQEVEKSPVSSYAGMGVGGLLNYGAVAEAAPMLAEAYAPELTAQIAPKLAAWAEANPIKNIVAQGAALGAAQGAGSSNRIRDIGGNALEGAEAGAAFGLGGVAAGKALGGIARATGADKLATSALAKIADQFGKEGKTGKPGSPTASALADFENGSNAGYTMDGSIPEPKTYNIENAQGRQATANDRIMGFADRSPDELLQRQPPMEPGGKSPSDLGFAPDGAPSITVRPPDQPVQYPEAAQPDATAPKSNAIPTPGKLKSRQQTDDGSIPSPTDAEVKAQAAPQSAIRTGWNARTPEELANDAAQYKKQASALYKQSEKAGATFTPEATAGVIGNVEKAISDTGLNHPRLHGDTLSILGDFKTAAEKGSMSLEELDQYRQLFNEVKNKNTDAIKGMNADGYKASKAIDAIDDAVENFKAPDIVGGNTTAIDALNAGREQWARSKRFERVSGLIERANGDPNRIKQVFKAFVNNKKNLRGFNEDEIAAIKRAGTTGIGENFLKAFGKAGFDFSKTGTGNTTLPFMEIAASIGGVPGALPAVVGGTLARQGQKFIGRGYAEKALQQIERRPLKNPMVKAKEAAEAVAQPEIKPAPQPAAVKPNENYRNAVILSTDHAGKINAADIQRELGTNAQESTNLFNRLKGEGHIALTSNQKTENGGLPNSLSLAAEGVGLDKTSPTAKVASGDQALPSQATVLSPEPGTAIKPTSRPSKTAGSPDNLGTIIKSPSGSPVTIYHTANDMNNLLKTAEKQKEPVGQYLEKVAKNTDGTEFYGVRIKDEASLRTKIAAGREPRSVSDYLGGRIVADNPAAMNTVAEQFAKDLRIIKYDDMTAQTTPAGYRAIHVQAATPEGFSYELQIVPKEILDAQEKARPLYEKWKELRGNIPEDKVAEFRADQAASRQLYDDAWEKFNIKSSKSDTAKVAPVTTTLLTGAHQNSTQNH